MVRAPNPASRCIGSGPLAFLCLLQLGCWKAVPLSDLQKSDGKELVGNRIRVERWPQGEAPEALTLDVTSVEYPVVTGQLTASEDWREGEWHAARTNLSLPATVDLREVTKLEVRGGLSQRGSGSSTTRAEEGPDLPSNSWVKHDPSLLSRAPLAGELLGIETREGGVTHLVVIRVSSVDGSQVHGQVESSHRLADGRWERLSAPDDGATELKAVTGLRIYQGEESNEPWRGFGSCLELPAGSPPGSLQSGQILAVELNPSALRRIVVMRFEDEQSGVIRGLDAQTYTVLYDRWGRMGARQEHATVQRAEVAKMWWCTQMQIARPPGANDPGNVLVLLLQILSVLGRVH
jgi:hypothetical protein